jgi:hypothetical protein
MEVSSDRLINFLFPEGFFYRRNLEKDLDFLYMLFPYNIFPANFTEEPKMLTISGSFLIIRVLI